MGLFFIVLKNIKKYAHSKILSIGFDDWHVARLRLAIHCNFVYIKRYLQGGKKELLHDQKFVLQENFINMKTMEKTFDSVD